MPRCLKTIATSSCSKGVIRKASGKAILDNNPILDSIVNSVNNSDNANNKLDIEVLVKDIAVNNNTFRATVEDLVYILGQIHAELPNNNILILNYGYRYWQYYYIRALITNYYSTIKAAKYISINITIDKLNNLRL